MDIITIKKQPKKYYQQQNYNTDITNNIIDNIAKISTKIIEANDRNAKADINNKIQDVYTKQQILTNDYKQRQALNPNDKDSYADYLTKYNSISEDVMQTIPTGYKNIFSEKIRDLNNQNKNELEIWKFQQNNTNNQKAIEKQINQLNLQAQAFGLAGDTENAIKNYSVQTNLIKENATLMFGEENANNLTQNLTKDYYTNYLNGVLSSNPEQIPSIIENGQIKQIIGIENSQKFIATAINRVKNFQDYTKYKEIANLMFKEKDITTQVLNGEIDYITLNNFLEENKNNISPNTKEYLLKSSNFSNTSTTKSTTKATLEDKANARNYIEEQLNAISIDPTKVSSKQIKNLQNTVFQYADNGLLDNSEVKDYLNNLNIYSAEILQYNTFEDYNSKRFIRSDKGAQQIHNYIGDIYESLGYGDKKDYEKNNIPTKYYKQLSNMKNFLYSNYRQETEKQLYDYAMANNVFIQNTNDFINFKNTLSDSELSNIYNKSAKATIKSYAENIGVDTTNKTPTEIQTDVSNKTFEYIQGENNKLLYDTTQNILNVDKHGILNRKDIEKAFKVKQQRRNIEDNFDMLINSNISDKVRLLFKYYPKIIEQYNKTK